MREHQLLPGGSGIILAVWHLHSSISSMLRRLPGLQVHFKLCTHGQNVRQHLPFQRKKASDILPMCMFAFCRTCMLKNQQLIGVFWPVGGVPLSEHNSSAGEIAGLTSHGKYSVSDRSCPNPAGCRKKKKNLVCTRLYTLLQNLPFGICGRCCSNHLHYYIMSHVSRNCISASNLLSSRTMVKLYHSQM